jgi:hypothetical protein
MLVYLWVLNVYEHVFVFIFIGCLNTMTSRINTHATFFDLIDLQVLPTIDCPHSASVPTSVARSHETLRLRPRRSIPTVPSGEKPFVESAFVEKPLLKNFVEKPFLKGFIGVRLTRPPFVFVPRSLR